MTLFKLSFRNAKRQAKDYLVYFVTIIMAAALVYAFNGLVFSKEILSLSEVMSSLPFIIILASVVVVCIIGWLVQYTTGFMLARRSRELGTYILIGLENRQVARLFFLENLVVGGIALVIGTILGNLIFQILRAITLALFHVPYTFQFTFSLKAIGLTLLYFALIYLFALFKSHKRIRKMKICELIYFDRKNEEEIIKRSSLRRKIFVVSIVLGVIGTALLLLRSLTTGMIGAGFIILFLYGFFISFSSGVPAYFDKRVSQKYKGQTLLIFRSLSAKLSTMGVAMATIALLFTATLISEGSGMLFHALFQSRNTQTTCFDLFIGSTDKEKTRFDGYFSYIEDHIPIQESWQYHIYQAEDQTVTDYIISKENYISMFEYDTLMKASDYTALRSMLGYPEVVLKPDQYYVHCMPYLKEAMNHYTKPLTVDGLTLSAGGVSTEPFTQSLWDGNGRGFILVVPDEALSARPISHSIYAAVMSEPLDMKDFEALQNIRDDKDKSVHGYDTLFSKKAVELENASMYAMVVFPLFYLAIVLTMVSATILTIQQLSEANRYRRQFTLLNKLGMDRRDMQKALRLQFTIYYTMPVIPPLLVSIPFILALGSSLEPGIFSGAGHLFIIMGFTIGLFFFIYFIYIFLAYTSLKQSVLPT